jgi:hypothetical protein
MPASCDNRKTTSKTAVIPTLARLVPVGDPVLTRHPRQLTPSLDERPTTTMRYNPSGHITPLSVRPGGQLNTLWVS